MICVLLEKGGRASGSRLNPLRLDLPSGYFSPPVLS